MAEIILSQPTAAEVNADRKEQLRHQATMEKFMLIRAQAAATIMASLVVHPASDMQGLASVAVTAADELLIALGMAERTR